MYKSIKDIEISNDIKHIKIYAENKFGEPYKLKIAFFYNNENLNVFEYTYKNIYSLYANLFYFLNEHNLIVYRSTDKLSNIYKICNNNTELFDVFLKDKEYIKNNYRFQNKYSDFNNIDTELYFGLNDIKCLAENRNSNNNQELEKQNFINFIEVIVRKLKHIKVNAKKIYIQSILTSEDEKERKLYKQAISMLIDKKNGKDLYNSFYYGNLIYGLPNLEIKYFNKPKKIKNIIKKCNKVILKNYKQQVFYINDNDENKEEKYQSIIMKIYKIAEEEQKYENEIIATFYDEKEKTIIILFGEIEEDEIEHSRQIVRNIMSYK